MTDRKEETDTRHINRQDRQTKRQRKKDILHIQREIKQVTAF